MPTMTIEFLGEVNIYLGLGIEIVTSMILGGLIGYDREKKMKSAGIKTNILICLGATLYTAISLINLLHFAPHGPADPNRIAAQIVSGIGFLGAGAILQGRGRIVGLTTAATIWVVAAIGVTIGSGYPIVASIFTFTILVVLKLLRPLYFMLESYKDYRNYHVEILSKGPVKGAIKQVILHDVNAINELTEEIMDKDTGERIYNVYFANHPRRMNDLSRELRKILQVEKVHYYPTNYKGEEDPS